ncbi:hypothetical protein SDC9_196711 [bioreactor metagenome]|uniref:Uncharacterized protein n=1 Tax=bioreactor metagenome TaxID=1076179 RepID=A0A645ICR1_9ZZZZ
MNTGFHCRAVAVYIFTALADRIKYFAQLIADKHADNCRRRFVRSEAVIVSGACAGKTQ